MRDENEEEHRIAWESKQEQKNKNYEEKCVRKDKEEEIWIANKEKMMEGAVVVLGGKKKPGGSIIIPRVVTPPRSHSDLDNNDSDSDIRDALIHSARTHRDRRGFTFSSGEAAEGAALTPERERLSLSLTLQGLLDTRLGTRKSPRPSEVTSDGGSKATFTQSTAGGSRMLGVAERLFSSSRTLHVSSGSWADDHNNNSNNTPEEEERGGSGRRKEKEGGKKKTSQNAVESGGEKSEEEGKLGAAPTTKKNKKRTKKPDDGGKEGTEGDNKKAQRRERRRSTEIESKENLREKRRMTRQKSRSLSPPRKPTLEIQSTKKTISEEPLRHG